MDAWLLENPEKMQVGVLFKPITSPNTINFVLQINATVNAVRGFFTDPNQAIVLPAQNAVQREISRYIATSLSKPGFEWNVDYKEFPHPALQTFSTVGTIGPLFFFSALLFSFVIQISALVSERELKLRQVCVPVVCLSHCMCGCVFVFVFVFVFVCVYVFACDKGHGESNDWGGARIRMASCEYSLR
jgi:hypothetical protein